MKFSDKSLKNVHLALFLLIFISFVPENNQPNPMLNLHKLSSIYSVTSKSMAFCETYNSLNSNHLFCLFCC